MKCIFNGSVCSSKLTCRVIVYRIVLLFASIEVLFVDSECLYSMHSLWKLNHSLIKPKEHTNLLFQWKEGDADVSLNRLISTRSVGLDAEVRLECWCQATDGRLLDRHFLSVIWLLPCIINITCYFICSLRVKKSKENILKRTWIYKKIIKINFQFLSLYIHETNTIMKKIYYILGYLHLKVFLRIST